MPRVVHFEIPADKPERAVKFYTDVFGWKMETWPSAWDYWLATTGDKDEPGINGAIMPRGQEKCVVNTIDVPSLDKAMDMVKKNGGEILQNFTGVTLPAVHGSHSYPEFILVAGRV